MQRFIEHECAYNDSQYDPALRIEISDSQTSVGAHSRYKHTQRETHQYDEDTDTSKSIVLWTCTEIDKAHAAIYKNIKTNVQKNNQFAPPLCRWCRKILSPQPCL